MRQIIAFCYSTANGTAPALKSAGLAASPSQSDRGRGSLVARIDFRLARPDLGHEILHAVQNRADGSVLVANDDTNTFRDKQSRPVIGERPDYCVDP
jgi:hypothetical protein